jgi:ABC-type cobalamin transport system permease subunit
MLHLPGFGLLEAISYTNDVSLAPLYLALNSLLSILIIGRIMCGRRYPTTESVGSRSRSAMRKRTSFQSSRSLLATTSRAVIESALTSWAAVFVAMMLDYTSKVRYLLSASSRVMLKQESLVRTAMPLHLA